MTLNRLIELIELKDKYAIALMDSQLNGMQEEQIDLKISILQKYVDETCAEWALVFICKHQELFNDRQTRIEIFRYFDSLGVKSGHTGKRFSEALYKQLRYLYSHNRAKQNNTVLTK